MLPVVLLLGVSLNINLSAPGVDAAIQACNAQSDPRLQELLQAWDEANLKILQLHYVAECTVENHVLKDKDVRRIEGFVKTPKLARVDCKDEKGRLNQVFICHDNVLESYDLKGKGIVKLNTSADWWGPNTLDWHRRLLCYDFTLDELKKRYDFQLRKEDKYWAYVRLTPKNKKESAWFLEMEVVLDQKTHLVKQVRMLDFPGSWGIYDYQQVAINPTPGITFEPLSKDLLKGFAEIDLVTPAED